MNKKRVWAKQNGPVFFHSWKDWNEGEYVEGIIVGTSIDKKYKRTNFHVKVEDFNIECTNQNGEPLKPGDVLVLNGCGILQKHLGNSQNGDAVRVEYNGMAEVTSGPNAGTEAHDITVYLEENLDSTVTEEDDGL